MYTRWIQPQAPCEGNIVRFAGMQVFGYPAIQMSLFFSIPIHAREASLFHAVGLQYPGKIRIAPAGVYSSFNNKSALKLMLVVESAFGNALDKVEIWLVPSHVELCIEAVADPAHVQDVARVRRVGLDLPSKAVDVPFDDLARFGDQVRVVAKDDLHQFLGSHHVG